MKGHSLARACILPGRRMLSSLEGTRQYSNAGKGVGFLCFLVLFSVDKASQKVMEQKRVILEEQGTGRGGRSKSNPTIGDPRVTTGKKEPTGPLSSSPRDFRWEVEAQRGASGCLESQTSARCRRHGEDSKKE